MWTVSFAGLISSHIADAECGGHAHVIHFTGSILRIDPSERAFKITQSFAVRRGADLFRLCFVPVEQNFVRIIKGDVLVEQADGNAHDKVVSHTGFFDAGQRGQINGDGVFVIVDLFTYLGLDFRQFCGDAEDQISRNGLDGLQICAVVDFFACVAVEKPTDISGLMMSGERQFDRLGVGGAQFDLSGVGFGLSQQFSIDALLDIIGDDGIIEDLDVVTFASAGGDVEIFTRNSDVGQGIQRS